MFTGIIEETGTVLSVSRSGSGIEICVSCLKILSDIKRGDSISINGVCQTVTAYDASSFTVFASSVTVSLTTFSSMKKGDSVNLERAMSASSRFGGHIVQGHVDGTGRVMFVGKDESGVSVKISAAPQVLEYVIAKGSIAVNGISLTVVSVLQSEFVVYLIPETVRETNISAIKSGDIVNIETDIIGRYIRKFTGASSDEVLMRKLGENGFI